MRPLRLLLQRRFVATARPFRPVLPRFPAVRHNSSTPPAPSSSSSTTANEAINQPSYDLEFTCRPCQTRSKHRISQNAYHRGSILIQCPGCRNRHVVTDHLKIFGEKARSLEEILKDRGEVLTTVRVQPNGESEDGTDAGDIEFLPKEEGEPKEPL